MALSSISSVNYRRSHTWEHQRTQSRYSAWWVVFHTSYCFLHANLFLAQLRTTTESSDAPDSQSTPTSAFEILGDLDGVELGLQADRRVHHQQHTLRQGHPGKGMEMPRMWSECRPFFPVSCSFLLLAGGRTLLRLRLIGPASLQRVRD